VGLSVGEGETESVGCGELVEASGQAEGDGEGLGLASNDGLGHVDANGEAEGDPAPVDGFAVGVSAELGGGETDSPGHDGVAMASGVSDTRGEAAGEDDSSGEGLALDSVESAGVTLGEGFAHAVDPGEVSMSSLLLGASLKGRPALLISLPTTSHSWSTWASRAAFRLTKSRPELARDDICRRIELICCSPSGVKWTTPSVLMTS
jgi:hypothetical protein